MNKTPAPAGFTISFSRHWRSWGWKQTYQEAGQIKKEQWGFQSRRFALADLHAEVERRKSSKQPELAEA